MNTTNKSLTNDVYTALLALAAGVVFATTLYVVLKCYIDYGTIVSVAESMR